MTGGLMFFYAWALLRVSADSRYDCLCFEGCCEEGWYQYQDSCYKPVLRKTNWKDAEDQCNRLSRDTHLASVHSDEENNYIYHLMGKLKNHRIGDAYWIGGKRDNKKKNAEFTWTDESKWKYSKFGAGQLDGLNDETYVGSYMEEPDGSVTWNDYPNTFSFPYICKTRIP
ncbi:snaclec coagulation factor IX/factor X-binding protein subunit A [Microcaecilia unicolor]|uniref:Snaclec coagulation factor IX/factor X-binding protein subunit A-like n=1 Tax=Microcaecilia unicolor TaxID=1415580 RepID=A0A6P7WLG1_9AMPH|nr:snaclec coagulation factor IX/factor X-binding protein subunit A-like [Microcaecilia unicolor]